MTSLTQKNWTNKMEISIESEGLLVNIKSIKEDLEYKIKFEELGFDLVKKKG